MELATVMSIVQTLLTAIQCSDQFKHFSSLFWNSSDFESLQSTLKTIYAVLEDAEAKHDALSRQEKVFVEELRYAVYDADDVLDEFFTLVQQKKLFIDGGKFSNKVKSFLFKFKPVVLKLSSKVNEVQEKLSSIADKTSKFSFKIDLEANKFRKEESCSFVSETDNIVGREADVDKIVNMLLDSSEDKPDVCFLPIVGMGGLGKTALAQLVYNDPRVTSSFPLKEWICVSDQDQHELNYAEILGKMFGEKHTESTLQKAQEQVRNHLGGKKYLLVLDDVWTEKPDKWQGLARFLVGGLRGTRIVVTTRSIRTAEIVGGGEMYRLRGLLENESWCLFEKMAFLPGNPPDDELVKIGKEIVKKCADAPLAIRVVGSLLRGQPKNRWVSFQKNGLGVMSGSENTITPLLKLSYYNLRSPLKSCFTYCALFPKYYVIYKDKLIRLWMAQGYIMPEEGRDLKDVAEEYLFVLWKRCFFQDVKTDKNGDIIYFKMHDLMHDIAEELAGKEICRVNSDTINIDGSIRHLGLIRSKISEVSCKKHGLRTFLRVDGFILGATLPLDVSLTKCLCLRTLDLHGSDLKCLPESIGKLLHLRYLDLSYNNNLEVLPQSVTKLHNLQTLDLSGCFRLKKWPKNIRKLVKLEVLYTRGCNGLTYMPMGLGHLTGLETLGKFMVGLNSGSGKACVMEELEELKPLNNLKGYLCIKIGIPKNAKYWVKQGGTSGGGYLRDKQLLNQIDIWFQEGEKYGSSEYEEALLDLLQPHPNLTELHVSGYHGVRMPRWPPPDEVANFPAIHLPHLMFLTIGYCKELRSVSLLGRLPLLKNLILYNLAKVEYVVEEEEESAEGGFIPLFNSLIYLELGIMPRLRGVWRRSSKVGVDNRGHLPLLNELIIVDCPKLVSHNEEEEEDGVPWQHLSPTLHELQLRDFEDLEYLPKGVQYCTSLKSLTISSCPKLKHLPTWMPNLTSLTTL